MTSLDGVAMRPRAREASGRGACRLCGSTAQRRLFAVRDLNYGTTQEEFSLVRCLHCRLVSLSPQPESLDRYYGTGYLPYQPGAEGAPFKPAVREALRRLYGYPGSAPTAAWSWSRIRALPRQLEVQRKNGYFFYRIPYAADTRILDVGCGNGAYLLSLKALGWAAGQLYGVDLVTDASTLRRLRDLERLHIVEGEFLEAPLPEEAFDVIAMRHVLEHLRDPVAVMRRVFRLLRPGGRVLINVPNFKSLEALVLFRERWRHIDAPRHLFHYSPKPMRVLLQTAGLRTERVMLKRSSSAFMRSLERSGYRVPHAVEKYVIRKLLLLFALFGYSGELLCAATRPREST